MKMVFQRLNIRKKQALEALVNGLHGQAVQEFGAAAKMALHLAAASKDPNITKGLIQESDVYVAIIKQLKELPKEQPTTRSNGSVVVPVKRWVPVRDIGYNFADVIGLNDVIEKIDTIMLFSDKHPDVADKYKVKTGAGMLLYGPPGTGKTTLAKAIAGELGLPFFNIKGNDVIERSSDKTIQNIRALFAEVSKYDRSVLYFDEVDSMLPSHPRKDALIQAGVEFQQQLDGFEEKEEGLLLIGATNRPWTVKSEMLRPKRFDHLIWVGFPDASKREDFFRKYLDGVYVSGDVDYHLLANETENATGADIENICENAKHIAIDYFKKTNQAKPIDLQDLRKAIQTTRLTINNKNAYDADKMDKFRQA